MGKKGTKRKTRWRVLPIGEDGGSGSGNEEEPDCDQSAGATGSYARATQHRPIRRQNNNRNPGGYYNKQHYHNNPRSYNNHDNNHQPLVTTEKHIFNEEEYTKITTPRQDVLFKKGYLGRKRPTVTTESSDQTTSADVINGNAAHYDPSSGHNEGLDNDPNEMLEEPPQFIYTNGFVDQTGVYYINGSGYEIFDPYSGQVTVVVGPPHYGPNGGPPVLAAVPCQPVPLQPLEWFNPPGFLPYVTAPGPPTGLPRDRRKRYSTDSQNCSPQSSESTGPPGSPQESDEVAVTGVAEGAMYPPPPPYVYPGYMFGAPMYNMNGVTVQSTPNAAPSSDVTGKRRKKKRRRRRRRNGVEDGSEESSSEDKDHEEEPMSVTSQESSLESDSKLSSPGENPRPTAPAPAPVPTKSHAHTQTVVVAVESEEAVETHQPPPPAAPRDAATDTTVDLVESPPLVNGVQVNGFPEPYLVNGDRLVNGHEAKPKKSDKRGKIKLNTLSNGVQEKPREAPVKQIEDLDEFAFQDDSFLFTQEFVNGNVKVELDEESEWITVKGHKGSQNKRSDSGKLHEDKKVPSELTNGHAKFNRLNGVSGGREKLPPKNNSDKFSKTDKGAKVEERCTYARAKQSESGSREKTQTQSNGRGKLVNGSKMDGNEKDDPPQGREAPSDGDDVTRKVAVEKSGPPNAESPKDVPRKSIQEVEETPPCKPSRKERRSLKNGGSPPKTPEVTLTATAKPFEMPSVSLRPETFVKKSEAAFKPEKLSREDSLLAALTVSAKDEGAKHSAAPVKEAKKTGEATKKGNGNGEKKKKTPQSPDASKVSPVKDLVTRPVEVVKEVAKESSPELTELRADSDGEGSASPPVPPPRRKKWRPSSKRLSSERAATPGKGESTDETSSSSSQESEESVIECLSSGFNSPRVKVPSGFSSDDDDVIYQGTGDEQDPKALGRISESQEESSSSNGKTTKQNDASKKIPIETPNKSTSNEAPKLPVPQISIETVKTPDVAENEDHLKNVRKIAQDIVDSIIQEALAESVRLKTQKENDPVKLGITDAVTRWLRSQSPDVLSIPRGDDSDSELSDDSQADEEGNTNPGSKNLKSNPLPAPSVENINSQLNTKDLIGEKDAKGRRVAKTMSDKKHVRNETPDLEDDVISNSSVSCGEWDLWDCQHTIPQNYDDIINKPQQKHTKNTNETNIISPIKTIPHKCPSPPQESSKYDPHANDTFSPLESTLLSETPQERCSNMCDPSLSVAKYYVLGNPLSPIEDIECSDSDASSLTETHGYQLSLAEELARLEQPLPESWAVEPIRLDKPRPRCTACHCHTHEVGAPIDSGVESGDEGIVTMRKREGMSVFKRRLVGRLKGEGAPFPYGGICCILQ